MNIKVLVLLIIVMLITGCGSSVSKVEKKVEEFIKCEYKVDLKCIVSSINYSGYFAYKKSNSSLDNFWDKYKELEKKNTNEIVLENAKNNYELAKNLFNQYQIEDISMSTDEIFENIYKVKTITKLKNKDRVWENDINYIVIDVDNEYFIIDMSADDRPVFVLSSTIEKMVKGLKYEDGSLISY